MKAVPTDGMMVRRFHVFGLSPNLRWPFGESPLAFRRISAGFSANFRWPFADIPEAIFDAPDKPCGWRRDPILFIHPFVINKKVRKIMYWLSLPNGAMCLNLWGSLTSKLDDYFLLLIPPK